ncbi:hypothetical protein IJG28_02640 [Candidatus Saccharibacteria bacterium]|nr:hypothetical protein [Candidatus Saccharibacteria bacterium]
MLVANSKLLGLPVLSIQTGAPVGFIANSIVDPNTFQIIAFLLTGGLVREAKYLDIKSIREYSTLGIVIDSVDELNAPDDIIKLSQVLELNFNLPGLKVETKKGSRLGHVLDFTVSPDNFSISQIIVKRPFIKSFNDPTLVISRQEIVEITDYKIIVKDEEKTLKSRAAKEDFVPNFVNPFREKQPGYAPSDITKKEA